ncbi:hypothetical protein KW796_00665 [Candidatus Parcubacteria bacterium]|nr:hypothetical protein [Candidatus Parcubacteria bacterium]
MRRTVIMLALCAPFALGAQEWEQGLYYQAHFDKVGRSFEQSGRLLYTQGYIGKGKKGLWDFISADTGYFSFALGGYYTPAKYFDAGVAVGLENILTEQEALSDVWKIYARYAAYVRAGTLNTDKIFLALYYESGTSTPHWVRRFDAGWYQAEASFSVGRFLFGGFSQTEIGTGPRVQIMLIERAGLKFQAWGSPSMYKLEEKKWVHRGVAGVNLILHNPE